MVAKAEPIDQETVNKAIETYKEGKVTLLELARSLNIGDKRLTEAMRLAGYNVAELHRQQVALRIARLHAAILEHHATKSMKQLSVEFKVSENYVRHVFDESGIEKRSTEEEARLTHNWTRNQIIETGSMICARCEIIAPLNKKGICELCQKELITGRMAHVDFAGPDEERDYFRRNLMPSQGQSEKPENDKVHG